MEKSYQDRVHAYGRVWMAVIVLVLAAVPVAISLYYRAWPQGSAVLAGLAGIVPIFWTVGAIEVFTYVPMLGTGGSYLAFTTGNLTNLKVPCALQAMKGMGVEAGTEEGDVVSTIAIAVSSLVTVLIIALGVLLISALAPMLESPLLAPAFDNILPALFGALAVAFVAREWKIALAPLAVMLALFLLVPSLSSSVGILVPVGALIAVGAARILHRKGMLA